MMMELDFETLVRRIQTNDPTLVCLSSAELSVFANDDDNEEKYVQLAALLQTNTVVTTVDLCHKGLTMTAWKAIIEMLRINKTVQALKLDYANFDFECSRLLATTLPFCSSLTHLDLRECAIGINGCYAIVKALSESPNGCQLEYLNLQCTMENDSGDVEMKKVRFVAAVTVQ
jgi:Ran GTPase-activating protein (RanGAP) involved in mRNA processing and transport